MKIIEHLSEETFETLKTQFENTNIDIIEKIHNLFKDEKNSTLSPIIVSKDKTKLLTVLVKDRLNGEEIAEKYRISVEKI